MHERRAGCTLLRGLPRPQFPTLVRAGCCSSCWVGPVLVQTGRRIPSGTSVLGLERQVPWLCFAAMRQRTSGPNGNLSGCSGSSNFHSAQCIFAACMSMALWNWQLLLVYACNCQGLVVPVWCSFAVCVLSALVEQGVLWSSCGLNKGAVSMWGCWTGDWVACSQALLTFHAHTIYNFSLKTRPDW